MRNFEKIPKKKTIKKADLTRRIRKATRADKHNFNIEEEVTDNAE